MERREFLSALVTAVGAGTVTLATPEETLALSVGEPVNVARIPESRDLYYPGSFLFTQTQEGFVPIGILVQVDYTTDAQGNRGVSFKGISQGVWSARVHR